MPIASRISAPSLGTDDYLSYCSLGSSISWGGIKATITQVGSAIPANALLTEDGSPILTEDGDFILVEP